MSENFKGTTLFSVHGLIVAINYYLLEFGWDKKWAWACYELRSWTKYIVN